MTILIELYLQDKVQMISTKHKDDYKRLNDEFALIQVKFLLHFYR